MALLSTEVRTIEDQKLISVMPSWDYRDYARQCSGCYDARQLLEMAMDGGRLFVYDR